MTLAYFLPGSTRDDWRREGRPRLARYGLAASLSDVDPDHALAADCDQGPDNTAGLLIVPQRAADGFLPDSGAALGPWDFRRYVGPGPQGKAAAPVYLGLLRDGFPTSPLDLARRRQFAGYDVELADSQTWRIPIIRRPFDDHSELPLRLSFCSNGTVASSPQDKHRELWDRLGVAATWFYPSLRAAAEPQSTYSLPAAVALALEILSLNYRVGPLEQNALGLIDSHNMLTVIGLAADLARVDESLTPAGGKKNETGPPDQAAGAAEPNTTPGGGAG